VKRLMVADKAGHGPLPADEFLIAIHQLTPKGKDELKAQLLSMSPAGVQSNPLAHRLFASRH
jgi:hypothetical protein